MSARVLVSGGLGFIGYHLCRELVARGAGIDLTIVDNLSSTRLDYSYLEGRARITVDDMHNIDNGSRFDEIYHLASPVGSIGILERSGTIAGDILGLAEKAAQLAEAGGARLLYVSSSEVYGHDGSHDEAVDQVVPCRRGARMEYALGKLAAEHVLLNRAMARGLEVRIVRPFNAMGEWQSAALGFVVPRFFEAAMAGDPLTVFGDGTQRRSFCHVTDIASGIIAVQEWGEPNQVYNVGNGASIVTITRLAEIIRDRCGSLSEITYVDPMALYGPGYIEAFDKIPETGKVTAQTGWTPRLDLDAALDRVYQFYQRRAASLAAAGGS